MNRLEVTIGENIYYIRRFDAFLALEVMGDLQKQFLGPVLSMQGATGETDMLAGLEKLSQGIDGRTLRLTAERLLNPEFVSVSIAGGEPEKLTKVAAMKALGSAADIVDLCVASVKFNFSDFMTRWGSLISSGISLPAAKPSVSSAQN